MVGPGERGGAGSRHLWRLVSEPHCEIAVPISGHSRVGDGTAVCGNLEANGADYVIIDDGQIADAVRGLIPNGVDAVQRQLFSIL